MTSRQELLRAPGTLRDKAIGAFAGLAIGDTLGDQGRTDAFRARHGVVTRLTSGTQSRRTSPAAVATRGPDSQVTEAPLIRIIQPP